MPSSGEAQVSLVPYVHVDADLTDAAPGTVIELADEERHHLLRVLRLAEGDEVEVADGVGTSARAHVAGSNLVVAGAVVHEPARRPELWVAQALPKGRKLDEVIRQVTELGVDGIVMVAADHSVAQIDAAKAERSRGRWASVARAASEQSRRSRRPDILGPVDVEGLPGPPGVVIVTDPGARSLPDVLRDVGETGRVTVAVGPEGGWSARERDAFGDQGALLAGLGPTVLRTEHAAGAAVSVTAALLGRWGTGPGQLPHRS
jgi:16S rRNA (uracil1498-N3)-methyltransferase